MSAQAGYHLQNLYWLIFIYLCMQGMDELIELFSQLNQLEKGALGLFFEMNHFVGISLIGYVCWFMWQPKFKEIDVTQFPADKQ